MRDDHSAAALCALLCALCILAALFLLSACGAKIAPAEEAKAAVEGDAVVFPKGSTAAARIVTEKVQPPMERELAMSGRLVWDEERTVRVFAPFAGRVIRIVASPGDRVAKGQALAEMMAPDYGQAQAEARKAEADLALSTQVLQRQEELHQHGVASAKDLQQAQTDNARARAEADRALGRMRMYGARARDGADFALASPIAGTVVERNLNPGQEVRPDQPGAPLFVVTDPTRLWIQLDAGEDDVRQLKPGMPLVISSNRFPEDAFSGELRQVADFVDPTSRTIKLRGVVPNPQRLLKAEMFVTARVRLPRGESPSVNAGAVFLSGVRRFVFVRESEGRFARRAVRVGAEVEGRTLVPSGLREGEEVVTSGSLFLEQMYQSARHVAEPAAKAARAP